MLDLAEKVRVRVGGLEINMMTKEIGEIYFTIETKLGDFLHNEIEFICFKSRNLGGGQAKRHSFKKIFYCSSLFQTQNQRLEITDDWLVWFVFNYSFVNKLAEREKGEIDHYQRILHFLKRGDLLGRELRVKESLMLQSLLRKKARR